MDPRSPSFEANLLYKTAQHPDIDLLVEDIRDALEEQSVILLYAEKVDGVFTLLTCDTMQILLAFTDVAIPVEHFLDAQRPAAAAISETEMLGKLTAHRSNVTVMVVDHEFDGPRPASGMTFKSAPYAGRSPPVFRIMPRQRLSFGATPARCMPMTSSSAPVPSTTAARQNVRRRARLYKLPRAISLANR